MTTETKKSFDLEKLEYVDVPVEKKEEPKAEEESEEEQEETKEEETGKEEKEEEETEEESKEEEVEEEESSEEIEAKKKEEESVDIDAYISSKYAKEYEIKNEEDLDEVLGSLDTVLKENEDLKKQIESSKDTKPKFKSDAQEKMWDFVKDIDPSRFGDRMQSYSRIVGMDVEKENPKMLLEEQFIMEHPELPRDRALKKFNHEYTQKFGELNRDDFETKDAFDDAKELREIDLEDAVHKARKSMKAEQAKIKTENTTQTEEKVKENPVVGKNIKANVSAIDDNMKEFSELIFSPTDDSKDDIPFKFTKDQKKMIHEAYKAWVGNPANYNAKGEFVAGDIDFDQNVKRIAYMEFGDDIFETLLRRATDKKHIIRAEEIATRKPDRKAKVAGEQVGTGLSEEKQLEMAIQKKKANAKSKSMVMR